MFPPPRQYKKTCQAATAHFYNHIYFLRYKKEPCRPAGATLHFAACHAFHCLASVHGSSFVCLGRGSCLTTATHPTAAHLMRACGSHRAACLSLFLRTGQKQKYRQTLVASNSCKMLSCFKPLFAPPLLHPHSPAPRPAANRSIALRFFAPVPQRQPQALFPCNPQVSWLLNETGRKRKKSQNHKNKKMLSVKSHLNPIRQDKAPGQHTQGQDEFLLKN